MYCNMTRIILISSTDTVSKSSADDSDDCSVSRSVVFITGAIMAGESDSVEFVDTSTASIAVDTSSTGPVLGTSIAGTAVDTSTD